MIESAALPSLLWSALDGLERAYIDEGAGSGRTPSLEMWANLLRGVNGADTDLRELPAILRLSKRAVRSRISSAATKGWVKEVKSGRSRVLRLTTLGSGTAARWSSLQRSAEERWRSKTVADRAGKLRACLEEVVAMMPLEHPHYPAGYGPADARITGGNGQDWKAVPRAGGDTVSHLPVSALVSQALVAFAMSYEEKSPVALSFSAKVIRRVPPEGRRLQELGSPGGIAALHRHGFLRVSGDGGSTVAHLTPKGLAVSEAYDERIRAVEAEWCNAFGAKRVAVLRRALAGC